MSEKKIPVNEVFDEDNVIKELTKFFLEDEQKEVINKTRRPKITRKPNQPIPKQNKVEQDKKALLKQAEFLKRIATQVEKKEKLQEEQKIESTHNKVEKQVKKAKKKSKVDVVAKRPLRPDGRSCIHDDMFDFTDGMIVHVRCAICSRTETYSMQEWTKILNRRGRIPNMKNPNKHVLLF